MDILITFVPLILDVAILGGVAYLIWRIISRKIRQRDQEIQQLIEQNKRMETALEKLQREDRRKTK